MGRTSDARDRLLESASGLIHERGYNAVGVSDICHAAGVNKGSFYHFFPSKQDLVLDVIDSHWHRTRAWLEESLLGEGPPLDRLRRHFESFSDQQKVSCATQGRQLGCPLANLGLEMSTQDSKLRNRVAQAFEGQIAYYEGLLREAKEKGDLSENFDPRQSAEVLVAFLEGKILLSKIRDDPETMEDLAPIALGLIGVRTI